MNITGQFDCQLGDFHLQAEFILPGSGISAIHGPSGCGKTSLLRAIAGLDRHAIGQLQFGGDVWQTAAHFLPAHQRPVAYVFQEANLFEHLDVQANVEYGWRRIPKKQRLIPLQRIFDVLDLGKLAKRRPATLSGGERQRVAIGRALAVNPRLLLMDEPLASLDQQRRDEILPCLLSLHREFALPIIYVSHDRTEISKLADHLLLMNAGRIIASDRCQDLLTRLDLPLAHEDAAASIFDAQVTSVDHHFELTSFRCGTVDFVMPGASMDPGQSARLLIAARDVSLALSRASDSSILNILPAHIESVSTSVAGSVTVRLKMGELMMLSRITARSADQLQLKDGMPVFAQVKSIALSGPGATC